MPVDIRVSDEATKYLNTKALAELRRAVEAYAQDLLSEAGRLEADTTATSGDPEITSTMVRHADLLLRRAYRRPRRKPFIVFSHIVATVGAFLSGILADFSMLKNPVHLVLFVALVCITVVATMITAIKD
jgi:hypothetical protein